METVQLYVNDETSGLPRPLKELKGFKKISLEPGEEKTVSFTLTKEELSYYDDKKMPGSRNLANSKL
jgi:beta-glucosidase